MYPVPGFVTVIDCTLTASWHVAVAVRVSYPVGGGAIVTVGSGDAAYPLPPVAKARLLTYPVRTA